MAQVSVTRALAEVKSLTDRIEKGTRQAAFISITVGGKVPNGSDLQTTANTLKANLQSVKDLIARRNLVKTAIIRSNATTTVEVNGVKMTVAEAIERKGSIDKEVMLLTELQRQLAQSRTAVERNNVTMQQRLDEMIKAAVGKDRKATTEEIDGISNPFIAANVTALLDPSGLEAVVEQLAKDIDGFRFEVDFALSEVNARTTIDV